MSISESFNQFLEKISPTDKQVEDVSIKVENVAKVLHSHYYPDEDYDDNRAVIFGSVAKNTSVRPPRDVDLLFVLPPEKLSQYLDNKTNPQSQLLQDVRAVLKNTFSTTEKIKAWGKVVLIEFSEGKHNVELLPAWQINENSFFIPNSEDDGSWEYFDPLKEVEEIELLEEDTGITTDLIKAIKTWHDNVTTEIRFYEIEQHIISFLGQLDDRSAFQQVVRDLFYLLAINDKFSIKSEISSALSRANKAIEYEAEGKNDESLREWQKIFGTDFPITPESNTSASFYIDDDSHALKPIWSFQNEGASKIVAYIYTYHKSPKKRKKRGGVSSNGRGVTKGLYLYFKCKTKVKGDYYWQVVNTGYEARKVPDLRGEIKKGNAWKWEHTKYNGQHWVKCYVVRNRILVSESSKFLVNVK